MIKVYRKTATIKAEQFDGSEEMIVKYHIRYDTEYVLSDDPLEYSTAPYQMETLEGWENINVGDWIASGIKSEHWAIANDVFKKTYAELPVIPENVACLIKQNKEWDCDLGIVFDDACSEHIWEDGVGEWVLEHSETFARAWLDGYAVEE